MGESIMCEIIWIIILTLWHFFAYCFLPKTSKDFDFLEKSNFGMYAFLNTIILYITYMSNHQKRKDIFDIIHAHVKTQASLYV